MFRGSDRGFASRRPSDPRPLLNSAMCASTCRMAELASCSAALTMVAAWVPMIAWVGWREHWEVSSLGKKRVPPSCRPVLSLASRPRSRRHFRNNGGSQGCRPITEPNRAGQPHPPFSEGAAHQERGGSDRQWTNGPDRTCHAYRYDLLRPSFLALYPSPVLG